MNSRWLRAARPYGIAVAFLIAAMLVMLAPPLLFDGAWLTWFYRGLVLLVIACPCALGLATPMSVMVGIGRGAQAGVLIRNAEAMEVIEKVTTVVVDKTGTLTEGKPRLTRIIPANGANEDDLLLTAASVEQNSEHPLAAAIVRDQAVAHERADGQTQPLDIFGVVAGGRVERGAVDACEDRLLDLRAPRRQPLGNPGPADRKHATATVRPTAYLTHPRLMFDPCQ